MGSCNMTRLLVLLAVLVVVCHGERVLQLSTLVMAGEGADSTDFSFANGTKKVYMLLTRKGDFGGPPEEACGQHQATPWCPYNENENRMVLYNLFLYEPGLKNIPGFLGVTRHNGDQWTCRTDEEWTGFTNWQAGEPSNHGGNQDCTGLHWLTSDFTTWDDMWCTGGELPGKSWT